ncbi:stage III sporulation protein AF [Brevibacillus sp. SYP-B805]|uniref:stage III sporulation protein AF n=1 Tax=Brevibacillus sp. SYP-B805 TaxID=1578199 RepID=UPI0013EDD1FD|nr:stage III sporulation protein AF [Brevibacillus sp. SYP-B805]NGQ94715.1 stage III sporulation protein AF [Brevibacillus sp. SYP-B805]
MEWLNAWLKKIILLVLLAAFLDLILPNTNLQRYVKMVMGLILLLTILSPVFAVFNLSQDDLALKLSRYQDNFQNASRTDWEPLAKKLLGQQEEQVTSYVKEQLESTIRQQVKRAWRTEPSAVEVTLNTTDPQHPAIQHIAVTFAGEEEASAAVQAVKPIEPVVIRVGKEQPVSGAPDSVSGTSVDPRDQEIVRWLAKEWDVREEQIDVIRTGGRNDRQTGGEER